MYSIANKDEPFMMDEIKLEKINRIINDRKSDEK